MLDMNIQIAMVSLSHTKKMIVSSTHIPQRVSSTSWSELRSKVNKRPMKP